MGFTNTIEENEFVEAIKSLNQPEKVIPPLNRIQSDYDQEQQELARKLDEIEDEEYKIKNTLQFCSEFDTSKLVKCLKILEQRRIDLTYTLYPDED